MILTVTANPALDYTIQTEGFELGKRGRYLNPSFDPAGKGINVSRMVRRLGEATLALGFSGGALGTLLRERLDQEGVPHDLVPFAGLTRVNVTLLTGPEGSATHLHGTGSAVTSDDVKRLLDRVSERLAGARLLVLSGSLPPGMDPGAVADLVRLARARSVRSLVDAEGEALAAAIQAGADVVKPNLGEASEFLGKTLTGVEGGLLAARELVARGAGAAVVTLRGDGAVASTAGRSWHVLAPREPVVRAIGAGDSFAAGLAVAQLRGADWPHALRLAAAAGTATALHSGTGLGILEEVARLRDKTRVTEL